MNGKLLRMKAAKRLKKLLSGTHDLHCLHTYDDEEIEMMVDIVLEEMDIDIEEHQSRHFAAVVKFNTGAIEDVTIWKYAQDAVKYRDMMDHADDKYEGEDVQYVVSPGHMLITKFG